MLWLSTPFEPDSVSRDAGGKPFHLLLLMSDERIYEAEYRPRTEEFYIFSRQETVPVTSPRIEHWTYATDIWNFHHKTV